MSCIGDAGPADFGTVSHAGYGMGFERLQMFVSGVSNIIPFARTPGSADF